MDLLLIFSLYLWPPADITPEDSLSIFALICEVENWFGLVAISFFILLFFLILCTLLLCSLTERKRERLNLMKVMKETYPPHLKLPTGHHNDLA